MANRDLSKQRRYWLQQFEDDVPVLNMPTDYPRPSIKTTNGNMMTFHFDEALKTQLQSYVEQHQMTDFMFLLVQLWCYFTSIHAKMTLLS